MSYVVYILGFSTGKIKIGWTEDLRRRVGQHKHNAATHGVKIESGVYWNLASKEDAVSAEALLLSHYDDGAPNRREFIDANFKAACMNGRMSLGDHTTVPADLLSEDRRSRQKYEIIEVGGDLRIRALKSLVKIGVHCGDLGGIVENRDSLSQSGHSWIFPGAGVVGGAQVHGDVLVHQGVCLSGSIKLSGSGEIGPAVIDQQGESS